MRIWVSCIAYQDAPVLRRMLESVEAFRPNPESMPIVVVDGRYSSFEGLTKDGNSDDETERLTRDFGGVVLSGWGPSGWPVQFVKRTAQFSTAVEGAGQSFMRIKQGAEGIISESVAGYSASYEGTTRESGLPLEVQGILTRFKRVKNL